MFSTLVKIFGTANDRVIKTLRKKIQKINTLEPEIKKLTDQELRNKTNSFRQDLQNGKSLDDILYEAFAVVREAALRTINQRHYDVQLIGGLAMHEGNIAEMRTGEGKTLVATLPAYLNALTGKGVHIVTVNDYLAKRDANWMGQIFRFLGMTVSYVISDIKEQDRIEAYKSDIVYVTNNELGFDYLRDNMKYDNESKVLKELYYAIIDEVDSILIDEARTPLIISGPVDNDIGLYAKISDCIPMLSEDDYEKDEKNKSVNLTEKGIKHIESLLHAKKMIEQDANLYDIENLNLVHHINQSLKAHKLFHRDVDYINKDNKILIIDEFTGRVMDGRRYSDGLHQAIEAKEKVQIQNENQTLASITFQNYFRMYEKLSGMTGTAMTEAGEFKDIYNLDVISVPTHKKIARQDLNDKIYGTKKEKYDAIISLIKDCHKRNQPVLVGTISIEKSEEISKELQKCNITHNVLNAKFHEQEASIIAQAGRYKAVTIATNMAGRGTDIMLGGNLEMMIEKIENKDETTKESYELEVKRLTELVNKEKKAVIDAGGLYVIGTERHESRRIDNQLRGRAGRQGDPGSTRFFLSLEDDLMRIFASDRISGILRTLGLKDGEDIQHPIISKSLAKAQTKVESHNYEIRKNLLRFDDVMNEQRKIIYDQRNDIIDCKNMDGFVSKMSKSVLNNIVLQFIPAKSYREDWQLDTLLLELNRIFALNINIEDIKNIDGAEEEIFLYLLDNITNTYKKKLDEHGNELMQNAVRYVLLATLDQLWKEHLHNLDYMRAGISLRAYGQKNPLNEYKREAFSLFEKMLDTLQESFIKRVCHLKIDTPHSRLEFAALGDKTLKQTHTSREDIAFKKYNTGSSITTKPKPFKAYVASEDRIPTQPETWGKISRNEACPCQSGKKYKHCHGAL